MFTSKLFQKIFLLILGIVAVNVLALYMLAAPLIRQASLQAEMDAARGILSGVDELVRSLSLDLDAYRKNALDSRKRRIRDMAELGASVFADKDGVKLDSPEARAKALKSALEEIGKLRLGEGDYVFVADREGTLLSHPDPRMRGATLESLSDGGTRRILARALKEALAYGESMAAYPWRDIKNGKPMEKISYLELIRK